jgi:hypothetical protein
MYSKLQSTTLLILVSFYLNITFATLPTPSNINKISFKRLGQEKLIVALSKLEFSVTTLTVDVAAETAKDIRKDIGKVRAMLDTFAYAFHPIKCKKDGAKKNIWHKFRADLDDGYKRVGDYKDLYEFQYISEATDKNDPVWAKKREKMIKWKNRFLKPKRLKCYRKALVAMKTKMNKKQSDQSKFYWGAFITNSMDQDGNIVDTEATLKPKRKKSGIENLGRLTHGLLQKAHDEYDTILALDNLLVHENAEIFHDYRKLMRTVVKQLISSYPEMLNDRSEEVDKGFKTLRDLVQEFGALNDKLVALVFYQKLKDQNRVSGLERQITYEAKWVQEWLSKHEIKDSILTVMSAL